MIARASAQRNLSLLAALALPGAVLAGPGSLTEENLRTHVEYLAADKLKGRDTGTPGCAEAENYIGEFFDSMGLEPPPGSHDHYLAYTLYRDGYDTGRSHLTIGSGERGYVGDAFRPFPFSGEGDITGEVVFAGYGITAPEYNYDDYADIDVDERIVIILRREPNADDPESEFDGTESTNYATFRTKWLTAAENGATAILIVSDPAHPTSTDDLRARGGLRRTKDVDGPQTQGSSDESDDRIPAIHVSRDVGYALIEKLTGREVEDVQRELDAGTFPLGDFLPNTRARLSVHRRTDAEEVFTRNVAGLLPGSDPELRDEIIVVGAHHDHVGSFEGDGDTIFNGADDNASGTAAVMELARAFAANAVPPRRSILFTTFSGEERGLLGSRVMVEQEQVPVDQLVYMMNMDMIGRNPDEPITISGDGIARGVTERFYRANEPIGLDVTFRGKEVSQNTDHAAFYDEGIPFLTFFSGFHEDYHGVGDHADKLAYGRMVDMCKVAYAFLDDIANTSDFPSMIYSASWLGLDYEGEDAPVITAVEAESRAAAAGLRLNDVIAKVGGEKVSSAREVNDAMQNIEPGNSTTLSVRRDDDGLLTFDVTRAHRGYLGIQPRPIPDERRGELGLTSDEGVLIGSVVAEGPAEEAGFEANDILISLGGRPVTTTRLFALLSQIGAGEQVRAHVLRGEDRVDLDITLGERPRRR